MVVKLEFAKSNMHQAKTSSFVAGPGSTLGFMAPHENTPGGAKQRVPARRLQAGPRLTAAARGSQYAPMDDVALSFMAHPDDTEFLCGGTLVLLARLGWKVHIAAATAGDCGSGRLAPEVIAAVRREEGTAAARVIGGEFHCLEQRDLRVFYNDETLLAASALLRKVRPRIVLTHSPSDYLPDHEQVSLMARAAAFAAPVP